MTKQNTNNIQGNTSFQSRLATYSTLAVAGVCAFAGAPESKADIVYSGPLTLSIPVTTSGYYINLLNFTFGTTQAAAGGATAPEINLWGTSTTNAWLYPNAATNRFVGTGANAAELAAGATIDATATFTTNKNSSNLTANAWTAGTTGYLGIRFLSGGTTGTTYYGWAQIFTPGAPSTANPIQLLGIAYDNTGAGITAGQTAVPEPGTVGCLAAGAIGAASLAWRRRKAA